MKFTPWWSQPLANHLSSVGFLQFCNLLQINLVKRCFSTSNLNGVLGWQFTKLKPFLGILESTFRTLSLHSLKSARSLKRRHSNVNFKYQGELKRLAPFAGKLRKSLLSESVFLHTYFPKFLKTFQKPSFRLFNPLTRLRYRRYSLLNERTPFFKNLKVKFSRKMRRHRRFKTLKSLSPQFYRLRRLWLRILSNRVGQTQFSPYRKAKTKKSPNTSTLRKYLTKFLISHLPHMSLTKRVNLPTQSTTLVTQFNKSAYPTMSRLLFFRFIHFTVRYFFSKTPLVSYFRRSNYTNNLSKTLLKGLLPQLESINSSNPSLSLPGRNSQPAMIRGSIKNLTSQNHQSNKSTIQGSTSSLLFKKYLTQFLHTSLSEPTINYQSYRVARQRRSKRTRRIRLPRLLHFIKPHRLRLKTFKASATFFYLFRKTYLLRRKRMWRNRLTTKVGPSRLQRTNIYTKLSVRVQKHQKMFRRVLKKQYQTFGHLKTTLTREVNPVKGFKVITPNYTLPRPFEDTVRIWWERTKYVEEYEVEVSSSSRKSKFHRLHVYKLFFRRILKLKKSPTGRTGRFVSWPRLKRSTSHRQKRLYRRFRLRPLSRLRFKRLNQKINTTIPSPFQPCDVSVATASKLTLLHRVCTTNFAYSNTQKTQSSLDNNTTYLTFMQRRTKHFKRLYFNQSTPINGDQYLAFESFRKLPFILSSTGFMYNPNLPKRLTSKLRAYINCTKYSFFNVLHIKRFILRERTGRPVLRRARYRRDRTTVLPYNRLLEQTSSSSFLDARSNNKTLPEWKDFVSLSQTFTHNPNQSSDNFNEYDDYNLRIRRIRFKPGYPRIWREARASLNQVLNLRFRYQHRLTVHLGRFAQISSSVHRKILDLKVNNLLIRSRFVFDLFTANNLVSSHLVFVNGLTVSNPNLLLFVGDVVQLIVHVKFYIVYRWLLNWYFFKVQRKSRLARSKFKKVSHAQTKQRSFKLPDWLLRMRNADKDIPKFVEVDFFTLSSFILYTPFCKGDLEVSDLLDSRIEIFNMYNWKYIN